jgi:hypothetical protein
MHPVPAQFTDYTYFYWALNNSLFQVPGIAPDELCMDAPRRCL